MYHGSSCLPKNDPERLTGERLGIAEAVHWNGTYTKRPGGPIVAPSNGTGSHEDPFLFQDQRGHYHAVTHNQAQGNLCGNRTLGSTCGAHLFSRDSYAWSISRTPVYTHEVVMEGGETRALQTRQRPQIIFDPKTGQPTILFNGASFNGDNGDLQVLIVIVDRLLSAGLPHMRSGQLPFLVRILTIQWRSAGPDAHAGVSFP